VCTTIPKTTLLPWGASICYDEQFFMFQEIVLGISLLVFMASFISSPRLRNAQSYKLLGFLGDFASHGLDFLTSVLTY